MRKLLSKSKYVSFCQCPKQLWLSIHKGELVAEDPSAMSRIETGKKVGDLAKNLFGRYEEMTVTDDNGYPNLDAMIERTKEAIQAGVPVIAEAAFLYDGCYCAVDVLKMEDDGYAIYEIKSSTDETPDNYLDDIAYQKWVLDHCGVNVTGVWLMTIDSSYVRGEELDVQQFFRRIDASEQVEQAYGEIAARVAAAKKVMCQSEEPALKVSGKCQKPGACPFWDYCTRHIARPSVFELKRMPFRSMIKYYNQGIVSFEQLRNLSLCDRHRAQIEGYLTGAECLDKRGIKDFLSELSYPIYFLDFETMQQAIPEFPGTRPYQQITFQYSLHYIDQPGGELKHTEFLGVSGEDPRRACAEQLCRDIPMNVCVTAYNKAFECTRIKEMAAAFPDLAEHLMNIQEHIVDLMIPFQQGMYYLPAMQGSYSIKFVLPALFPNDPALDYHNLPGSVHNGSEAMTIFPRIKDMPVEEQEKARYSLLKYCELDTYAMVKVWEKLIEAAQQ